MLTWAIDNFGEVVRAAKVRALPSSQRPTCKCPSCHRELFAVRSPRGRDFFRHAAESDPCYATAPEGALHLEAKRLLREHLNRMASERLKLVVSKPCEFCRKPIYGAEIPLQPGDIIREEEWLDPLKTRKPDLTAWRDNRRFALFELVATNPCEHEKWAELRNTGLPVVEVLARTVVGGEEQAAWASNTPLLSERTLGFSHPERCAECEAVYRRKMEMREQERLAHAAREAQQEEARKQWFNTRHERVVQLLFVDLHYPDGRRIRRRLILSEVEYQGMFEYRLLNGEGKVLNSWGPTSEPEEQIMMQVSRCIQELTDKIPSDVIKSYPKLKGLPHMLETERDARQVSPPMPVLWWDAADKRWVTGHSPKRVKWKFPRHEQLRAWLWLESGVIPTITVRAEASSRKTYSLIESTVLDEFLKYARGEGPRPSRLDNLPEEVKRKMKEISEAYERKKKREQDEIEALLRKGEPDNVTPKARLDSIRKIWPRLK